MRRLAVGHLDLEGRHLAQIRETAQECGFEPRFLAARPEGEDAAWLDACEVLFTGTPELVPLCGDSLRWVHTSWAGVNAYCAGASQASGGPASPGVVPAGVLFTNNAGSYGVAIAEHVVMLLLMIWRGECDFTRDQANRVWGSRREQRTVHGATFGVLGCGDIGISFAKAARALGAARIIGVSRSGVARVAGVFDEMHALDGLDGVLPRVDALVMSLPATAETGGVLDARRIAFLPSHAAVVNVGRGSAIDEAALVDALNAERLGGAALDVFQTEPLPAESPLWAARNCIVTPHVAGNLTCSVTRDLTTNRFCENLRRYASGRPLVGLVDMAQGY